MLATQEQNEQYKLTIAYIYTHIGKNREKNLFLMCEGMLLIFHFLSAEYGVSIWLCCL